MMMMMMMRRPQECEAPNLIDHNFSEASDFLCGCIHA